MGKMKQGIFFTFIAIVIMAVFVLVLTPQADISLQKDNQAIRTKIDAVDSYISNLENTYLKNVLEATTYKAILSLVFYVNSTGEFMANIDPAVSEIMINGTLNEVPIDSINKKKIMENNTLTNWSDRITRAAKETFNVDTNITIINVSVTQTDPWRLTSRLSVNTTIKFNAAEWKRSRDIITAVGLEGLYDPYYLLNTPPGLYDKRVKKSDIPFDKWNISQVRSTLKNATYIYWKNSKAPGFLMRFSNNTNSSACCGIESLIDPNILSQSQAQGDQRESYVDYLFWSHAYNPVENCTQLYNITNPATGGGIWDEFSYFKLDLDHVVMYNITAKDAKRNC